MSKKRQPGDTPQPESDLEARSPSDSSLNNSILTTTSGSNNFAPKCDPPLPLPCTAACRCPARILPVPLPSQCSEDTSSCAMSGVQCGPKCCPPGCTPADTLIPLLTGIVQEALRATGQPKRRTRRKMSKGLYVGIPCNADKVCIDKFLGKTGRCLGLGNVCGPAVCCPTKCKCPVSNAQQPCCSRAGNACSNCGPSTCSNGACEVTKKCNKKKGRRLRKRGNGRNKSFMGNRPLCTRNGCDGSINNSTIGSSSRRDDGNDAQRADASVEVCGSGSNENLFVCRVKQQEVSTERLSLQRMNNNDSQPESRSDFPEEKSSFSMIENGINLRESVENNFPNRPPPVPSSVSSLDESKVQVKRENSL